VRGAIVILLFGLGFVVMHQDNQLDQLRNRIQDLERSSRAEVPKSRASQERRWGSFDSPESAKPETHDEKVERVRRESAQRRKAYCDSHPNLAVRIGCE
jgi:hypothetical protein